MVYSEESPEEAIYIQALTEMILDAYYQGDPAHEDDALAIAFTMTMGENIEKAMERNIVDDTGDD